MHCRANVSPFEKRTATSRQHRHGHFSGETSLRQALAQPFSPRSTAPPHGIERNDRTVTAIFQPTFRIEGRKSHLINRKSGLQTLGRFAQRGDRTWVQRVEHRQNAVTHEVAPKLCVGVRTIGHKRLSQRIQEIQNLRFAHFQPRSPHPVGTNGAHRREPTQSRTAQQAQQQRFCLIFGMMGHKNRAI